MDKVEGKAINSIFCQQRPLLKWMDEVRVMQLSDGAKDPSSPHQPWLKSVAYSYMPGNTDVTRPGNDVSFGQSIYPSFLG